MKIQFAHLRVPSTSGGLIDIAVFEAKATSGGDSAKASVLAQLTSAARAAGLKIDQSALAFMANGRLNFYGDKNLVDHLSRTGSPVSNREITI